MPDIKWIKNENGPTLGTVSIGILEQDGQFFKDFERDGKLAPYADWRLPAEKRAEDLAGRLSVEEIAGLMLYSAHQMVPGTSNGPFTATYGGKKPEESEEPEWALTDQQKEFLTGDHLRNVLAMGLKNGEIAARWNNEMQALCEQIPHAIPVNICSDPRHGAGSAAAEFKSEAKTTSKWPSGLGLAATFDPETARRFGRVAAQEYRALGITTELGPQFDLGTEPRWMRVADTFGASPDMVRDIGKAYCEGLQTDPEAAENAGGWGASSVAAMGKHWPGGGPCEGGRDAHYPYGKFAVYPGDDLKDHLKPFLEGAFNLDSPTGKVAAVMPYYTVSWNVDPSGDQVGNSYSYYIIQELLRDRYGYDGVICTDWGITPDPADHMDSFGSRCYGVHYLTEAERHLRILESGVDQFGGNNAAAPILEAYAIGCKRHGDKWMRERFELSARRILTSMFRLGLFENPYLDPAESVRILGCKEFTDAGFEAQLRSIVLLKNNGVLPLAEGKEKRRKVFIPHRHIDAKKTFFRTPMPAQDLPGASREAVEKFYDWADTPEEADFAICFIESPISDGYQEPEKNPEGQDTETEPADNGYRPVMLQYRPYTAVTAREQSIAGGDFRESFTNRSYRGKSNRAFNESDLDAVLETRKAMGDKPVIVVVRMNNPCVLAELEQAADAILVDFGVQTEAMLTVISGGAQPAGRLPVQLPADMETVEAHCEDVPLDMRPYVDSAGHAYDFGFGMNWEGVL